MPWMLRLVVPEPSGRKNDGQKPASTTPNAARKYQCALAYDGVAGGGDDARVPAGAEPCGEAIAVMGEWVAGVTVRIGAPTSIRRATIVNEILPPDATSGDVAIEGGVP